MVESQMNFGFLEINKAKIQKFDEKTPRSWEKSQVETLLSTHLNYPRMKKWLRLRLLWELNKLNHSFILKMIYN